MSILCMSYGKIDKSGTGFNWPFTAIGVFFQLVIYPQSRSRFNTALETSRGIQSRTKFNLR